MHKITKLFKQCNVEYMMTGKRVVRSTDILYALQNKWYNISPLFSIIMYIYIIIGILEKYDDPSKMGQREVASWLIISESVLGRILKNRKTSNVKNC